MDADLAMSVVGAIDCGTASVVTRGDIYMWPWFEESPPPFNRYCAVCSQFEEEREP